MGLFSKKKESESCCCGDRFTPETLAEEAKSGVKVPGSGCAKCNALEETGSAITMCPVKAADAAADVDADSGADAADNRKLIFPALAHIRFDEM